MRLKLDDTEDSDDPILSLVNLIDVFLVVIAALMLAIANNPLNPFSADDLTLIRNPGQANMEIINKSGAKIERFKGDGELSNGKGVRAGIAYRLNDGSLVYVPDAPPSQAAAGDSSQ